MIDQKKGKFPSNRNRKVDLGTMVFGKIPPQAKEMEEAVLGSIMIEKEAIYQAGEILRPESFYVDGHQRIFRAMQEMSRRNQPIDIHTVSEELRKTEELEVVGGVYYITKLTNAVVSAANIQHHCRIIYEKFLKREVIRLTGELLSDAYEDSTDAFNLVDQLEKSVQSLTLNHGSTITGLDALLVERFKRIVELKKQDQHITGVPSGFPALDEKTHGWQNAHLIILAARPGVGKTVLALNMARNAAKISIGGKPSTKVGFFSLEMSKGELVDRVLAAESEVALDKIQTGKLEEAHLMQIYQGGVQPLSRLGIFVDDTPGLNIYQLRSKARYMIRKFGVGIIFIDYLQLMSGVEDRRINNREQEISNITRNLKLLAKELEVPVIALSQLSREVEKQGRGEKNQPKLSHLRESGAIEQDADVVMFIYRPEYYDITDNEMGESTSGLTEISIAKNRSGRLATGPEAVKLRALLHIQKFVPWQEEISIPKDLGSGAWRPVTSDEKGDELPFK